MKLCESVDVFSGSGQVAPGGSADFAIWLSASGANLDGVTVSLATKPTSATAHFTVCPSGNTNKCTITTLTDTGFVELLATVAVPASSTNGQQVTLNAKTTATKPALTVTASASVKVVVPAPATATSASGATQSAAARSAAAGSSGSAQSALSLVNGSLPLVTGGQIFNKPGGSIGALLPSIPAVTPSPQAGLPVAGGKGGTEQVASAGPLDRRLVGTQLIALAALCAAVGIVVAKLTLRTPRPAVGGAAAATAGATTNAAADAGATTDATAGTAGTTGTDSTASAATATGTGTDSTAGATTATGSTTATTATGSTTGATGGTAGATADGTASTTADTAGAAPGTTDDAERLAAGREAASAGEPGTTGPAAGGPSSGGQV